MRRITRRNKFKSCDGIKSRLVDFLLFFFIGKNHVIFSEGFVKAALLDSMLLCGGSLIKGCAFKSLCGVSPPPHSSTFSRWKLYKDFVLKPNFYAAYRRCTTRPLFRAKKRSENAFYRSDAVRLSADCKLSVTQHAYSCR